MTIKETAGKILLYFYQLQRTVPSSMTYRQLAFVDKKDGGMTLTTDKKWLTKDLQDINPAPPDTYNAFSFLVRKGLIQSVERTTRGTKIYVGVQVTDEGIDMVEGVERSAGQEVFANTFNISADVGSVEDLIKNNLGNLLDEG